MEVKVLLEQFSFMMGGPLTSGCWRIEVAVRERKVYVGAVQAASLAELPEAIAEEALVELPSGRRWLRKLDKLAIAQRWRSRFVAETPLAADTKWQLLYKEQGKNARHITGLGAFPENWASFLDCLNELPDVAIRQENHLEHIRFLLIEKVPVITGRKKTIVELREKLVIDRRKRMILYNRHKEDFGTERHAYELPKAVSQLLDALDKPEPFEQRLHVRCIDGSDTGARIIVRWQRHDRLEAGLTCRYDAQDMPLDWPLFLRMLHEAMGGIRGRFFALDRFPLADATASVRQP